ncbi:MAG: glycerophosphodiester phosphodiesterase [Rhizobiaceae bacterium]|jgi:glycerophosphoryl diester phosphodiesterase|nr:glycerophosphodiester phosphodiesterase [Rhizobiaceae bacterium]
MNTPRADWLKDRPIAHRGLHDGNVTRFENTLSAFEAAARAGYAIECDVVLAADGVPMVFHDLTLERLTDQTGDVIARDSAALARLSIGGTADHIPTLHDALRVVAGRVPVVIELKGHDASDHRLVAAVAAVLDGYSGKAALMSFDHWLVRRFALDAPGWPGGLTAEGTSTGDLEAHCAMLAHGIGFASFHVHELPNPFVTLLRERLGLPVITWTVRTAEEVELTRAHADQMTFEGFLP